MKYWVTTQWPHSIDDDRLAPHFGLYIPDGRDAVAEIISPGDIVFIYESKTGRAVVRTALNGQTESIESHVGREGIVTIARVTSQVYEDRESELSHYTDGTEIWWRYYAETEVISSTGFVSHELVNNILGYNRNYSLRGFGTQHSGVKQITDDQADQLIERFRPGDEKSRQLVDSSNSIASAASTGGGEGELHKRIKNQVASDPAGVFSEAGLELVQMEHSFPTGDRVDVLLRDRFGRFVVVEVEPECISGDQIGAAQCMKYRALMAFEAEVPENEVRSILVATFIADDIEAKARTYSIQTFVVQAN